MKRDYKTVLVTEACDLELVSLKAEGTSLVLYARLEGAGLLDFHNPSKHKHVRYEDVLTAIYKYLKEK